MTPHEIIIRPIVTEKTSDLGEFNKVVFEIHRGANKIEVRKAVELVFGVRVDAVNTMVVRGDLRRVGRHYGKTRSWKKAIVTLHEGDSIDFYGEQ